MKHQTNWNKTLANPDDYSSSWDWTVAHSEYHFNNTIQDQPGDWFDVIGRFEGDWKDERDRLVQATHPVNWSTRKHFAQKKKDPEAEESKKGAQRAPFTQINRGSIEDQPDY